jgi:hypothetical protein
VAAVSFKVNGKAQRVEADPSPRFCGVYAITLG